MGILNIGIMNWLKYRDCHETIQKYWIDGLKPLVRLICWCYFFPHFRL